MQFQSSSQHIVSYVSLLLVPDVSDSRLSAPQTHLLGRKIIPGAREWGNFKEEQESKSAFQIQS